MVHYAPLEQLCQVEFFDIVCSMKLNFDGDEHIYVQLADLIRAQVYHKQLQGKIPGIRDLAEEYSINVKTVNRAITLLIDEGLLYRVRGKGTFVVDTDLKEHAYTTCGLILSNITNPNFARYAQLLAEEGYQQNISFAVNTTGSKKGRLMQIMSTYKARGVAAVIIHEGTVREPGLLEQVVAYDIPLVGLHTHAEFIDDVWPDVRAGAQLATDHLIENFEGPVGFISGSDDPVKKTGRYQGYRDSLLAHDLQVDFRYIAETQPTYRAGYNAVLELFERKTIPRALFFYNQIMTMGGISALIGKGYRVPDDVAVIGTDDCVDVDEMLVPTSAISFPYDETARQLVHLLRRRVANKQSEPQSIRIAPRLIVRDSSRKQVIAAKVKTGLDRGIAQHP
jgi:LacI family transcriptional regulator